MIAHYDLRSPRIMASKQKSIIKYGIDTIAFMGPQIWQNILFRNRKLRIT